VTTLGQAIMLAVVTLVVCGTATAQPLFAPTQDPVAGSRLFGSKGCVKCHAIKGVGGHVGPDLGRIERPHSFFDLAAAMWNHAPRMADRMRQLGIARPTLEGRETGDLVAFLFTVDYFERAGNAEVGGRLFREKRCIVCHQAGGVGGVIGPNLDALGARATPISVATAMWTHGPQMADALRAKSIARPTFKPGELRDLIAYVRGSAPSNDPVYAVPGDREQGRRLFAEKHCLECHGTGGGAAAGPDLAAHPRLGSTLDFAAAMWNKAPGMTAAMKSRGIALVHLEPGEMADILAYLYAVRYVGPRADPRRGVFVVADKGCLGCHALGTERGKSASDLTRSRHLDSPGSILGALWNHAFIDSASARRPQWAPMTGDELADLMVYLRSLGGGR
jgi:mono/diheme cytochrome c family protein